MFKVSNEYSFKGWYLSDDSDDIETETGPLGVDHYLNEAEEEMPEAEAVSYPRD